MKNINKYVYSYKNMKRNNPFFDEYVKREIKEYGLSEYYKNGIKIDVISILGRCDDYLNVNFRIGDLEGLRFQINNHLWMSLTPMEIQSHYIPILRAKGNIAVGGLGMGYYLLKVMKKSVVFSIDVYESEQSVVDFFKENFSNRNGFDKVKFIVSDARKMLKKKKYDFVYMDIYSDVLPDEVITDKKLFTEGNTIKEYHFWCQEKIVKAAYEKGIIDLWKIPAYLIKFFKMWSVSEGAQLKDYELSNEFIEKSLPDLNAAFK